MDSNGRDEIDYVRERSRSRSPARRRSRSRSRSLEDNKVNSKRIYVSNIPFEAKWMNLKDLFKKEVGDVTYVEMFNDANGRSLGTGLVEFKDIDTAQRAVDAMHQFEFLGRKIVVREERLSDTRRLQRIKEEAKRSKMNDDVPSINSIGGGMSRGMGGSMGGSMGGGMGGGMDGGMGGGMGGGLMNNMGNMNSMGMQSMALPSMNMPSMNNYGLTPQLLNQLGIEGPLTNQIFIANLDYKVNDKKLREIFKMAGRIEHLQLKTDKEGKSRGLAICRFEYPYEAVQAISMFGNQHLYDRPISVRMDKMASGDNSNQQPERLPAGLKGIGNGLGFGGNSMMMNSMNMNAGNMGMGSSNLMGMNPMMGNMSNMGMNMNSMGMNNMGGMGNSMSNMGGPMSANMMGGMNNNDMMSNSMPGGMAGGMSNGMAGGMSTGMSGGMSSGMPGGMSNAITSGLPSGISSSMSGGMSSSMPGGMPSGVTNVMSNAMSSMGSGLMNNMNSGMNPMGMGMKPMDNPMSMGGNMNPSNNMNMSSNQMPNFGSNMNPSNNQSRNHDRAPGRLSSGSMQVVDESSSVYVRDLPFSYTWQDLKEKFRHIGEVRYAAIKTENGKSKGCGVVRFGNSEHARMAVHTMHTSRIDGRQIDVSLLSKA